MTGIGVVEVSPPAKRSNSSIWSSQAQRQLRGRYIKKFPWPAAGVRGRDRNLSSSTSGWPAQRWTEPSPRGFACFLLLLSPSVDEKLEQAVLPLAEAAWSQSRAFSWVIETPNAASADPVLTVPERDKQHKQNNENKQLFPCHRNLFSTTTTTATTSTSTSSNITCSRGLRSTTDMRADCAGCTGFTGCYRHESNGPSRRKSPTFNI